MPKVGIIQYDATAGNNTDVNSVNIAEGCAPSGINNAIRQEMADLVQRFGSSVSVASSGTVALGDQEEQYVTITGTTTITSFGTSTVANKFGYWVYFSGSLTLTHGASLILPGSANITTQAGDCAWMQHEGSGVWRMLAYMPGNQAVRAAFRAHRNGTNQTGLLAATATKVQLTTEAFDVGSYFDNATNYRWTPPAGTYRIEGNAMAVGTGILDAHYQKTMIYKNGSLLAQSLNRSPGNTFEVSAFVSVVDQANGTDYYELWVERAAAGDYYGLASLTYMCGERVF